MSFLFRLLILFLISIQGIASQRSNPLCFGLQSSSQAVLRTQATFQHLVAKYGAYRSTMFLTKQIVDQVKAPGANSISIFEPFDLSVFFELKEGHLKLSILHFALEASEQAQIKDWANSSAFMPYDERQTTTRQLVHFRQFVASMVLAARILNGQKIATSFEIEVDSIRNKSLYRMLTRLGAEIEGESAHWDVSPLALGLAAK